MKPLTGYEQFILVSFELCQKAVRDYSSKFSKKTYRQCQHLTLLLLRRRNKWTYRETEEQVASNPRIQELLGLSGCPDYSTLQKFYRRLGKSIIEELFGLLLILARLKKLRIHEVLLLGIIYNTHRGLQLGLLILCPSEGFQLNHLQ